jgi:hypothetical protein
VPAAWASSVRRSMVPSLPRPRPLVPAHAHARPRPPHLTPPRFRTSVPRLSRRRPGCNLGGCRGAWARVSAGECRRAQVASRRGDRTRVSAGADEDKGRAGRMVVMAVPAWLAESDADRPYRHHRDARPGAAPGAWPAWVSLPHPKHAFARGRASSAPWDAPGRRRRGRPRRAITSPSRRGPRRASRWPTCCRCSRRPPTACVPDGCRVPGARGRALRVARAESAHGLVSLPHQGPRPRPASRL